MKTQEVHDEKSLVAELYLGHGLRAEAAQLLEDLTAGDGAAVVWLALGRVHLETGLATEATEAFGQALAEAQAAGELEAQAAAQVGLGLAARLLNERCSRGTLAGGAGAL